MGKKGKGKMGKVKRSVEQRTAIKIKNWKINQKNVD